MRSVRCYMPKIPARSFLGKSVTQNQNMSEETARLVDAEIKRLVTEGYEGAKKTP